jgi:hypothetical protein
MKIETRIEIPCERNKNVNVSLSCKKNIDGVSEATMVANRAGRESRESSKKMEKWNAELGQKKK